MQCKNIFKISACLGCMPTQNKLSDIFLSFLFHFLLFYLFCLFVLIFPLWVFVCFLVGLFWCMCLSLFFFEGEMENIKLNVQGSGKDRGGVRGGENMTKMYEEGVLIKNTKLTYFKDVCMSSDVNFTTKEMKLQPNLVLTNAYTIVNESL